MSRETRALAVCVAERRGTAFVQPMQYTLILIADLTDEELARLYTSVETEVNRRKKDSP